MDFRKLFNRFRLPIREAAAKNESGIALFMVIAAITILSVIVTEFTYVAQVNSRMAIDSVDSIKAHYLAKTGLKISLLRLKAYQTLKAFAKSQSGGGSAGGGGGFQVPSELLEQIWSMPFVFPIPKSLPGLTPFMRDEIQKFEDESSLPGKFSATIESDSSRLNLNSVVAAYAAVVPSPSPSPGAPSPTPSPSGSPTVYDPQKAREQLKTMIGTMIDQKMLNDQDFAEEIGNNSQVWLDEFFDNFLAWVDFSYQPQNRSGRQEVPYKRAPLFNLTELLMIHPMDDRMYQLFQENFTAGMTQGINVNKMEASLLRTFFPGITDEEVTEFFKFRDDPEQDNRFKSDDDFWKYVGTNFSQFRGDQAEIDRFKDSLKVRGVKILIDEESFKIRVVAEVNAASRIIEAWVTMSETKTRAPAQPRDPNDPNNPDQPPQPGPAAPADSGPSLRITFMRES